MRRALVSPLLSAFVLPGLGQLVNRQVGKGAALVSAVTLLLLVGIFMFMRHLTQAMAAVAEAGVPEGMDKWAALRAQLMSQGDWWVSLFLAALAALWIYSVLDAFRWGRALDAQDKRQA